MPFLFYHMMSSKRGQVNSEWFLAATSKCSNCKGIIFYRSVPVEISQAPYYLQKETLLELLFSFSASSRFSGLVRARPEATFRQKWLLSFPYINLCTVSLTAYKLDDLTYKKGGYTRYPIISPLGLLSIVYFLYSLRVFFCRHDYSYTTHHDWQRDYVFSTKDRWFQKPVKCSFILLSYS